MSEKTFNINGLEFNQLDVSAFGTSYTDLQIIEINNKGTISEVWRKAYPCEITTNTDCLEKIIIDHNGAITELASGSTTISIPVNSNSSINGNVLTISCENGDTYTLTAIAKARDYDYNYYFDNWNIVGSLGQEHCNIDTTVHKEYIPYITVSFTSTPGSSWSSASYTVKSGSVINNAGNWGFSVTDINGQVYTNSFARGVSDNYYVYNQDGAAVKVISDTYTGWPYTAVTDTVVHGDTPRDFRTYGLYLGTHSFKAIGNHWGLIDNGNSVENWDYWQAAETSCWDNGVELTDLDNTTFRSTDIITIKRQDIASSNSISYVKVERDGAELYKWTITKNTDIAVHGLNCFHLNGNNKNEILAGDENCDAEISGEFGALKNDHSGWFTSANKLDIYAHIAKSAQWDVLASDSENKYNNGKDINNSLTAYTCGINLKNYPSSTAYPIIAKFEWHGGWAAPSSNSRVWLNLACGATYTKDKKNAEVQLQDYNDTLSLKVWASRGNHNTGNSGGSRLSTYTAAQRKY